jgi:hypothetical protein
VANNEKEIAQSIFLSLESPTSDFTTEIIPIEDRLKTACISPNGLYPHEIIALYYAHTYRESADRDDFQGFWLYQYGVNDVPALLCSLAKRGFLRRATLENTIREEKMNTLKEILQEYGLKINGNKETLILRVLREIDESDLDSRFTYRKYQLTELGEKALSDEIYITYIHRNNYITLDVWEVNKIVYTPPKAPLRDKILSYFSNSATANLQNRNYKTLMYNKYATYHFLLELNDYKTALIYLCEVLFWALSGLDNHTKYQTRIEVNELLRNAQIHARFINDLAKLQNTLNMSENELKAFMLNHFSALRAPFHIFTTNECIYVIICWLRKDCISLSQAYRKAEDRLELLQTDIIKIISSSRQIAIGVDITNLIILAADMRLKDIDEIKNVEVKLERIETAASILIAGLQYPQVSITRLQNRLNEIIASKKDIIT